MSSNTADLHSRADQQPDVGKRLGREQVGFVEHQQQRSFDVGGATENLLEEPLLAATRRFAETSGDELQEPCRGELRQVAIHGLALLWGEFVQEPLHEGRFADAAGAGHQADFAVANKIVEPGEPFFHPAILPESADRRVFGEGLAFQLEMVQIHQAVLSSRRRWS